MDIFAKEIDFSGIEKALHCGCFFRLFRSGRGVRIAVLDDEDRSVGYGESSTVEGAIEICGRDYLTNHEQIVSFQLNGHLESVSRLDQWVMMGYHFHCWKADETIFIFMEGFRHDFMEKHGKGKTVSEAIIAAFDYPEEMLTTYLIDRLLSETKSVLNNHEQDAPREYNALSWEKQRKLLKRQIQDLLQKRKKIWE